MAPKISVLMPVYNAEQFLREAIDSILNQTFTDFEFIIIDDGSSDKSTEIVNSYSDPRIQFYTNTENLGISQTLNRGIDLTNSDLIARMDADDISLPDRLMKQYHFLDNHPDYSFVSTSIERISEENESLGIFRPDPDSIYYNLAFHCYGIFHPTVMYRKQAVVNVGMYPITLSEDYRLWSKLIKKYRFFSVPEVLVKYRTSSQSISQTILYDEYRDAEKNYILDNLQYYMGKSYSIPDTWLEIYRNNFLPISQHSDIKNLAACIHELDVITESILAKENINRNPAAIRAAAREKKAYILESILQRLSYVDRAKLLSKIHNYRKLSNMIFLGPFRQIKKIFQSEVL